MEKLQRDHREGTETLRQQSMRMATQEEYLAQLTELQLELTNTVVRIKQRMQQIEDAMPRRSAGKGPKANNPSTGGLASEESFEVAAPAEGKMIVGRNEWVWVALLRRNLKARIDTGILHSSLSAIDPQPFERDGRDWIRFRVPDEEHPQGGDVVEAPLEKYARTRQASADAQRRPVVRLKVRLGEHMDEAEFYLANHQDANHQDMVTPLLLGRSFLRDVMLVDVAQKFTRGKVLADESVVGAK